MCKLCLSACLFLTLLVGQSLQHDKRRHLEQVKRGLQEYKNTGLRPDYLNNSLSQLQIPNFFRDNLYVGNTPIDTVPEIEDDVLCDLCYVAANYLVAEIRGGMPRNEFKNEATGFCELLKIESNKVCDGIIELNIDILIYIYSNNPNITANRACNLVFQQCSSTEFKWTIDLPDGYSPSRPKPTEDSTFKILHISDIHLDPRYTQGKVRTCKEPLCCQDDQDDGDESTGNSCGYWSSYGNDVSEHLVDEMIRFANTLEFDYVYFTGDIISHRVWSTTEQSNTEVIKTLLEKFKGGFKVPVFPILGNHEPSPINVYDFENNVTSFSTQWLLDLVAEEWAIWLDESSLDSIHKGGFYTVSPEAGLRIIVLNDNVAYVYCWWLIESDIDPYGQLDWLVSILEQAERQGESVHILTHHPSGGDDVLNVWSREYNKIVNRFANTITGQFNGHIHIDSFQVHYNNSNTDQAINVAWNGASLVPMDYANPSFKIYTIDKDTYNVIDIDEWTFNLTLANLTPDKSPEWYKIYSFREAYGIPTLQPEDMGKLLHKMASNHNLLADYHLHRYKNSDRAVEVGCNSDCQKSYICQLSTYVSGDTTKCNYFKQLFDENS